jgi:hypothetical protein
MKKLLIIIGLLIALILGCVSICIFSIPFMFFINNLAGALTPIPDMNRYVTQEDLIGVWIHTPSTERIIARYKPSGTRPTKCHLALYRDGTCDFDSVYGRYDSFAYRKTSGNWILEHDTEGNSNIRKKNAIAFDMKSREFAGNMYLNITEKKGKLILWEWHGDPDSREFIEYMKEEVAENNDQQIDPEHTATRQF